MIYNTRYWGNDTKESQEVESTGFPSQIAVTKKKARIKSYVNKQKLSVTSSVNQMVIR